MAFNLKKKPLAQAIVSCDNLASHLYIIYYFTSINFVQSLMPQQEVVIAALAETAFTEHPLKLLVDFIYKV